MKTWTSETLSTRRGPAAWFTGDVWLDEVVSAGTPPRFKATRVSFAPGARTAWHTHPLGQALHVLSGVGWVQLQGEPAHAIGPGDSVWIEAGELHWHGASADHTLVHLAMQEVDAAGVDVVWLDPVSGEDYRAAGA